MIDTYFIQIADLLGLDLETVRASSGRVFRDVAKREDAERRREQNYERQRAQTERSGSAGGRASGSRDAGRGAWASGATPPVSAPVEEEPYDYVPLDAYGAAPWRSSTTCRRSMCLMVWALCLWLTVRAHRLRRRPWFYRSERSPCQGSASC